MEKHYFIVVDTMRDFNVRYGTYTDNESINTFKWLWAAKVRVWFENRNLTRLREFNDHQLSMFSGDSLELPPGEQVPNEYSDQTTVMEAV